MDRLDRELILSVGPGDSLATNFAKLGIRSDVYISFETGKPEFNLFHRTELNEDRNISLFLKRMDAIEKNGIFRVRGSTEPYAELISFAKNVVRLPTVVLVSIWLVGGRFYTNLLFNHQIIEQISSALMDQFPEGIDTSIEYIGESGGFKAILHQINQRSNILIAQLDVDPPEHELSPTSNPVGDAWTRILKFPLTDNELSCVYFTDEEIGPKQNVLRLRDRIYEAETSNKFIHELEAKLNENRLPVEARLNILKDRTFTYIVAFPSIFRDEFTSIISDLYLSFSEWKPNLVRLQKYGEWVDEFLN